MQNTTAFPALQASAVWKLPFSRGELALALAAFARAAGMPGAQVELLLPGDKDMEALHAQSLGRRGPTNVLSFPLGAKRSSEPGKPGTAPLLGSLALSPDTLQRECLLYGQDAKEHCIRLLAHGFAHLLGYEHGPDMERLCLCLEQAARSVLCLPETCAPALP